MVNTDLLKQLIGQKGLKYSFIAKKLGISDTSWRNKLENKTSFKLGEVSILCQLLEIIDLELKEKVFFAKKVEK